jgi:hypothetical protein
LMLPPDLPPKALALEHCVAVPAANSTSAERRRFRFRRLYLAR